MQAQEIMTKDVVMVLPDTRVAQVARPPLEHKFSAAPVVDRSGMGVGMVSEGDLIGRSHGDRQEPGDWWLSLRAEDEAFHPDFLATFRRPELTARDVMSAPVVSVTENVELARLLGMHRIKRAPVIRDGNLAASEALGRLARNPSP
jgi:CBS domain-containing protein